MKTTFSSDEIEKPVFKDNMRQNHDWFFLDSQLSGAFLMVELKITFEDNAQTIVWALKNRKSVKRWWNGGFL